MLNSLRRRAKRVGLGISKQYGEDYYMVFDLYTNVVVGGTYYTPYPFTLEDVEGIVEDWEKT